MTAPALRNSDGNYEIPGHGEKLGFSRIKGMKASKALETYKLKQVAMACQWATASDASGWVDMEPYDLVREIDDADSEKADQGTCVGRAIELLITLGLTPAAAALMAVEEQEAAVAKWREWEAMTDYARRKAGGKKARPHRLNFTPPVDLVISCVEGFAACVTDLGFNVVATEITVFHSDLPYAGTADIFGRFGGDGPVQCWDIKNGSIWDDMAIQLAAYAHATHWIRSDDDGIILGIDKAPAIDKLHGGIFDVKEDRTLAIPFQLDAAWEAFRGLIAVRRFEDQRGVRGAALAAPTMNVSAPAADAPVEGGGGSDREEDRGFVTLPSPPPSPTAPEDPIAATLAWTEDRIRAIKGHDSGVATLKANWPSIPFKPPWTDEQLAAAVTAVVRTAELIGLPDDPALPFGPADPTYERPVREAPEPVHAEPVVLTRAEDAAGDRDADPEAVAALQARGKAIHPAERKLVQRWQREAEAAGVPFGLKIATIGNFERARAAIECATQLAEYGSDIGADDTAVRAAIDFVTDTAPSAPTGALIGYLTLAQAVRLADGAAMFPSGELGQAIL